MFCITYKSVKIGATFSFFAVVGGVMLLDNVQTGKLFCLLTCCCLHELGHIFSMVLFFRKPEQIVLYGGGIRIKPSVCGDISALADVIILISGCAVNFLLGVSGLLWCGELDYFVSVNIFLACFNMMPYKYFDGGRVLDVLLGESVVKEIVRSIFIILLAAVIITGIFFGTVSVSLLAVFGCICLSEFLCKG